MTNRAWEIPDSSISHEKTFKNRHGKSQILLFPMKSPSQSDMGKHHTSKSPFSPLKNKHKKALSHDLRVLPQNGTGKCLL